MKMISQKKIRKLKSHNNKRGLIEIRINFHSYELLKNKTIQKNSNSNNHNQDLVDLTEIKNLDFKKARLLEVNNRIKRVNKEADKSTDLTEETKKTQKGGQLPKTKNQIIDLEILDVNDNDNFVFTFLFIIL